MLCFFHTKVKTQAEMASTRCAYGKGNRNFIASEVIPGPKCSIPLSKDQQEKHPSNLLLNSSSPVQHLKALQSPSMTQQKVKENKDIRFGE